MADLSSNRSIITFIVNGLNASMKKTKIARIN